MIICCVVSSRLDGDATGKDNLTIEEKMSETFRRSMGQLRGFHSWNLFVVVDRAGTPSVGNFNIVEEVLSVGICDRQTR
jgi:hypothetical protein